MKYCKSVVTNMGVWNLMSAITARQMSCIDAGVHLVRQCPELIWKWCFIPLQCLDWQAVSPMCLYLESGQLPSLCLYNIFVIIFHTLKMSVCAICMAVLSVVLKLFHCTFFYRVCSRSHSWRSTWRGCTFYRSYGSSKGSWWQNSFRINKGTAIRQEKT
jgi:hypothetical protein